MRGTSGKRGDHTDSAATHGPRHFENTSSVGHADGAVSLLTVDHLIVNIYGVVA